jgi:hypothetical protein
MAPWVSWLNAKGTAASALAQSRTTASRSRSLGGVQ